MDEDILMSMKAVQNLNGEVLLRLWIKGGTTKSTKIEVTYEINLDDLVEKGLAKEL